MIRGRRNPLHSTFVAPPRGHSEPANNPLLIRGNQTADAFAAFEFDFVTFDMIFLYIVHSHSEVFSLSLDYKAEMTHLQKYDEDPESLSKALSGRFDLIFVFKFIFILSGCDKQSCE